MNNNGVKQTMQKTEFTVKQHTPETAAPRAERCETCRYVHNSGRPVGDGKTPFNCHRGPPIAQAVLIPTPDGGVAPAGAISTFPPVAPNEWCGEWKSALP